MLSDIAVVTRENEPRTLAYGWFKSTGDNSEVPNHHVRGFEVYKDESALADVHRSSEPYKIMRSTVGQDHILAQPTDLRFLRPAGIGFMTRPGKTATFLECNSIEAGAKSMIVVLEIKPKDGRKTELLEDMESLAVYVEEHESGTASFWVLEYLREYLDHGITVFSRFENGAAYQHHLTSPKVAEAR